MHWANRSFIYFIAIWRILFDLHKFEYVFSMMETYCKVNERFASARSFIAHRVIFESAIIITYLECIRNVNLNRWAQVR